MRVERSYDNINRSMVDAQSIANDHNSKKSKPGNSSFTGARNSNSQRRPPLPLKHNTIDDSYSYLPEEKPTLGLALKLEVAKKPINQRPHFQETAFVLEEILQAVE